MTPILLFFADPPTTEIYTLSLHDALPIYRAAEDDRTRQLERFPDGANLRDVVDSLEFVLAQPPLVGRIRSAVIRQVERDRKSTRLNSSHGYISYAVFCLKKNKQKTTNRES